MLSVHRFQSEVSRRTLLSFKNGNLHQIVFKGGKWTGRGGSSRLESRVELTPSKPNVLPEGKGRLLGPVLFTTGVIFIIIIYFKIINNMYFTSQVYRIMLCFGCYLGI